MNFPSALINYSRPLFLALGLLTTFSQSTVHLGKIPELLKNYSEAHVSAEILPRSRDENPAEIFLELVIIEIPKGSFFKEGTKLPGNVTESILTGALTLEKITGRIFRYKLKKGSDTDTLMSKLIDSFKTGKHLTDKFYYSLLADYLEKEEPCHRTLNFKPLKFKNPMVKGWPQLFITCESTTFDEQQAESSSKYIFGLQTAYDTRENTGSDFILAVTAVNEDALLKRGNKIAKATTTIEEAKNFIINNAE